MRQCVHKWFWIWDFEKEEKWLNEMAAKGLLLVSVGFGKYIFEDCDPGTYTIRLEMLDHTPSHAESQQYIKFMEETGATYLGSLLRWVYFKKKTSEGVFDIYSDRDSRIKHLNRILTLNGVLIFIELSAGMNMLNLLLRRENTIGALAMGFLPLGFAVLLIYGFIKLCASKKRLQKERQLFE